MLVDACFCNSPFSQTLKPFATATGNGTPNPLNESSSNAAVAVDAPATLMEINIDPNVYPLLVDCRMHQAKVKVSSFALEVNCIVPSSPLMSLLCRYRAR